MSLVRYIQMYEAVGSWENLTDDTTPYTLEELNARIDEAEDEIERGEGKSFNEMMAGFKREFSSDVLSRLDMLNN